MWTSLSGSGRSVKSTTTAPSMAGVGLREILVFRVPCHWNIDALGGYVRFAGIWKLQRPILG